MRAVLRIMDINGSLIHMQSMPLPPGYCDKPIHLDFRVDRDQLGTEPDKSHHLPPFGLRIHVTVERETT